MRMKGNSKPTAGNSMSQLGAQSKDHAALQMLLGTLRSNNADDNKDVKKTIGFISKTITLHMQHAFMYISLPVFARL